MTPEQQTLLEMYKTECEAWRHQESQRTAFTNLFLIISAALIGLVTYDDKFTGVDVLPAIMIILLGLFGLAFSAKYYERYHRHIWRAWIFKIELEGMIEGISFIDLDRKACLKAKEESFVSQFLFSIRLHWFWFALYALISLLGLVILLMVVLG